MSQDDLLNSMSDGCSSSDQNAQNPDATTSGLNLHDSFLKRHLFEASPVEPMPPIDRDLENLLDLTLTKNSKVIKDNIANQGESSNRVRSNKSGLPMTN